MTGIGGWLGESDGNDNGKDKDNSKLRFPSGMTNQKTGNINGKSKSNCKGDGGYGYSGSRFARRPMSESPDMGHPLFGFGCGLAGCGLGWLEVGVGFGGGLGYV